MKRARRIPPLRLRKCVRPRYKLADLIAQMPDGAPIDVAWDTMPAVGREIEPPAATLRTIRAMKRFMRTQRKRQKRTGGADLREQINDGRD